MDIGSTHSKCICMKSACVCWSSNSKQLQIFSRMSTKFFLKVETIPKANVHLFAPVCVFHLLCKLYHISFVLLLQSCVYCTYCKPIRRGSLTLFIYRLIVYIIAWLQFMLAFVHVVHLIHFRPMCMTSVAAATSTNSKNTQTLCSVWLSTLPHQR